ncbi:MAG: hypothetical protein WC763_07310 [Candidatus Paceibacterota bacterium]|jgi:hypothetical protein
MSFKDYIGHFTLRPSEFTAARRICKRDKTSLSGLARLLLVKEAISRGLLPRIIPSPPPTTVSLAPVKPNVAVPPPASFSPLARDPLDRSPPT